METKHYRRMLRLRWPLIVGFTAAGILVALLVSFTTAPVYQTQAELQVTVTTSADPSVEELARAATLSRQLVASYVEGGNNPSFQATVLDEAGLGSELPDDLTLTVVSPVNSAVLRITGRSSDPDAARAATDALAEGFEAAAGAVLEGSDGEEVKGVRIRPLGEAATPEEPVSPKTALNVLGGGLTGALIGLAVAAGLTLRDRRLFDVHEFQAAGGAPVLGALGEPRRRSEGALVDEFRRVAATVRLSLPRHQGIRLALVPCGARNPAAVAIGVAEAFAAQGNRVLLIDADTRTGALSERLGLEGAPGLTDLADDARDLRPVAHLESRAEVLPIGTQRRSAGDGLIGLLDRLVEHLPAYDVVLYQTADLPANFDGAVVASAAGRALLVGRSGGSTEGDVSGAAEAVRGVGGEVAGVLVTELPDRGPDAARFAATPKRGGAAVPSVGANRAEVIASRDTHRG